MKTIEVNYLKRKAFVLFFQLCPIKIECIAFLKKSTCYEM